MAVAGLGAWNGGLIKGMKPRRLLPSIKEFFFVWGWAKEHSRRICAL
jgi:hypothetical protein